MGVERRFQRDKTIYSNADCFWRQLHRYGNPEEAMQLYLDNLNGADRIAVISGGPRLLAVMTAIPSVEEIVMYDIFPGPLEATEAFIGNPDRYWEEYQILRDEINFLDQRNLKPRLDESLVRLCLRDEFEPDGYYDGVVAEEVAFHPPPENLRGRSNHTLKIILDDAYASLYKNGRVILTAYPGFLGDHVIEGSLLHRFQGLVNDQDIDLCEDGKWLDIGRASHKLSGKNAKYRTNRERFWLNDLTKVRMYGRNEVVNLAGDRFTVSAPRNIRGGAFPFAKRSYYTLWKTP
jgi:hypothetical protein